MKTFKSFAFAVALAGLTLPMAGCSDDDTAPKGEDVATRRAASKPSR